MKQKGFTLIELLVVIAIIGLLSSLAIVSLNSARDKANDVQIKSDLAQIRTIAELTTDGSGDYTDFDAADWAPLTPPSCSPSAIYTIVKEEADLFGDNAGASYAVYAILCSDNDQYFCVDSTGNAVELTYDSENPEPGGEYPMPLDSTVKCQY
jgi:prepilin-type N-terminal cleavage/methylation domain-containing protein